jgi:peptidase S41-like protein
VRESQNDESKRKSSHRLHELNDLVMWKMPAFNLTVDEVDGLMDKARSHKKLIIDLRGNGGGNEETLLRVIGNLFDREVKIGDIQRRKELKPLPRYPYLLSSYCFDPGRQQDRFRGFGEKREPFVAD